jgi:hypothetical protein
MPTELPDIPPKMQKVLRRFERWRSAHTGRLPIPKRLWAAAVKLAAEHGVFHTAKALRLEYGKLKQLLESTGAVKRSGARKAAMVKSRRARSEAPPEFMELLASPAAAAVSEGLIELEGRRGKMRIQWKGTAAPDLGGLGQAFWESQ